MPCTYFVVLLGAVLARLVVSDTADSLTLANNDLTVRVYRHLSEEGGNVFFCPFSITVAMAMLLRGLKGETAEEVRQALSLESVADDDIHHHLHDSLKVLSSAGDSYTFSTANALIVQKLFPLLDDYKYDLQQLYEALAMEVDFENETEEAVSQINEWVKKQTQGVIPKVFDTLSPITVVVLANAVYFKGTWEQEFDPDNTRPWPFLNHGLEANSVEVPTMFLKKSFPYTENESSKMLELPYKGGDISMLIVLPKDNDGLSSIEEDLHPDFIRSVRPRMYKMKVEVSLPKFRLEYSKRLETVFQAFGVQRIFSLEGDFTAMSQASGLAVSEIVHKATLEVNEEGCEAAAVTAVVIQRRCMEILPEFLVDHPFLFLIFDKRNDMILFAGRVDEL